MDDGLILAMPASGAARLAGITERRLRGWEARELVSPSTRRQISDRNTVRLYGFSDLLAVLVVRELVDRGAHPLTIGRLVDHLRRDYGRPLTEVRWAVDGARIYVQHRDGTWVGDQAPDQIVLWQLLDLEPLRDLIRAAIERGRMPQDEGRISRARGVMGSKPTFAGTRIPVEAVHAFLSRGHDPERILAAYPQLVRADIAAAEDEMSAA